MSNTIELQKPTETLVVDFEFSDQHSLHLITPVTQAAMEWADANIQSEPHTRMGPSITCEPRMSYEICVAVLRAGFVTMKDGHILFLNDDGEPVYNRE